MRWELEPKCVPQLSLGSLLGTRRLAIGHFFPVLSNRPRIHLFLFYFICHTIITKTIGKEEKKKWRGDLTETVGAYERLGLLEL